MSSLFLYLSFVLNHVFAFDQLKYFEPTNITIENIPATSQRCQSQSYMLDNKIKFQMLDASAKSIDGLLPLNAYHLGDFEGCYGIIYKDRTDIIYGKYCLGVFSLDLVPSSQLLKEFAKDNSLYSYHAICVPNGCNINDLQKLTTNLSKFTEEFCYSQDKTHTLTWGSIIGIIVLAMVLVIVIMSTALEIIRWKNSEMFYDIVLAFSVIHNGQKFIKTLRNGNHELYCINGIRAISMVWIVLVHTYLNSNEGPIENITHFKKWEENSFGVAITKSALCVDSFFAVSGILTVYTFLGTSSRFNICHYYIHRYFRLTPPLAAMVLLHATLLPYLGNGPLWSVIYDRFAKDCRNYWWAALFHVQTFVHGDGTCVPQSWYVSVAFQLFVLSPMVLLPLQKWPKLGIKILTVLALLGCIIPFIVGTVYEVPAFISLRPNMEVARHMMWHYYKQTYTRFGPFVIGMIAGYFIHILKKDRFKIYLRPIMVALIWFVSLIGLLTCIFVPYLYAPRYDVLSHSFTLAFQRNVWAACVCGVIFLCVTGYAEIVNTFLSLPIFQLLNKLSYSMYLVHYVVISIRYASMKTAFVASDKFMLQNFWTNFIYTIPLAAILCFTIELPIIELEKYMFRKQSLRKSERHILI